MPKLNLDIPMVNACGIGSYLDVFDRLEKMRARFGGWICKSIGPFSSNPELQKKYGWKKEKLGNPNPVTVYTGHVLLNSMALPTHPVESWIEEFENTPLKKPIIGSVWGIKPEDYAILINMVDKYVQAWQLNVSCPNKEVGEKSVMESMTSQIKPIIESARQATDKPLIAKLSPNEDYVKMAEIIAPNVDYICCGNSVGPGLVIDIYSRRPVLAGVYGGMTGAAIKPLNVKMVNDVYEVVRDSDVEVMASGGIGSWEDMIEYAIAGASLFELGTDVFSKVVKGQMVGRTTEGVVEVTKKIWRGVKNFLREENVTLDELVGTFVK